MKKRYARFLLNAAILGFVSCGSRPPEATVRSWVNFEHLNGLCQDVWLDSSEAVIVHVYSEYPSYKWVDAGKEGIACVDDAARAAILYMVHSEWTGDKTALPRIRGLLNFVMYMQSGDGGFWNFIDSSHQINTTGVTSRNSFNFWAVRGYWALGFGIRFFRPIDGQYADSLRRRFLWCREPVRQLLSKYGTYKSGTDRNYPAWLVNEHGSDATSEFLLGIDEFLKTEPDSELTDAALKLSEGILSMQLGNSDPFPGAFLSWLDLWHGWANSQTAVLTGLGSLLSRPDFIKAAEQEAGQFYPALIDSQFFASFALKQDGKIDQFPQISYGIYPVVAGLTALCRIMEEKRHGAKAGLAAAWLFGRNPAGMAMYDPKTGRCFDGIESEKKINLNSGAESTIEALKTLVEVGRCPEASRSLVQWTKENRDRIGKRTHSSKQGQ